MNMKAICRSFYHLSKLRSSSRGQRFQIDSATVDARALGEKILSELALHMAFVGKRIKIELKAANEGEA
jgi:hypothetical protein